ncbi:BatA domain-containing protein [Marivirga sp. S37H4]|uniref:BatA domain-containing protein n=1 Tax=Marivirga aurantiaca TaxID=2802615 RepID=A0A934X1X0_9BACT|nr:BatA domain-containing protein [Marivirga aurantiaca]MBK6267419.1 BatA domain-containing protein [Marivirga aurantiaca]
MSLVNPIWLWGLMALLIPLLIHLWSKQKTRVLPFGSIRFLKESSNNRSRSIQLTSVLLMLLRMLIITLLVLLLAKWVLPSSGNEKKQNWLLLGDGIDLPQAYENEIFEVYQVTDLKEGKQYLNQWYFMQEIGEQYPEIDSLVWIDNFRSTDFWGEIPALNFSYKLINHSNDMSEKQLSKMDSDTAFYKVLDLKKSDQLLINNILKSNSLYTNNQVVFSNTAQTPDILFSSEVQDDVLLQFIFTDDLQQTYKVDEQWSQKIIYLGNLFLKDKRKQDELLVIISEHLAQWRQPLWSYNDFDIATNVKRDEINKVLKNNTISETNEILFWIILVLFMLERFWVYQKANA